MLAEQKRSFCGAMEANAGTLKSLVLAGELSEPARSHPNKKFKTRNYFPA